MHRDPAFAQLKHIGEASIMRYRMRRSPGSRLVPLLLAFSVHHAYAQVDPAAQRRAQREADLQQQREQQQRQSEERQRMQDAPDGRLPESTAKNLDDIRLPKEADCHAITRFELDLPEALLPAQRLAGASTLPQDPFRFARDALQTYQGQCVGYQGFNLIGKRIQALIAAKGYITTTVGIASTQQELDSGTWHYILIPGIINSIQFNSPDIRASWKTAFPSRPGGLLNVRDLEQGLEQLKRMPSQDVDMHLNPGAERGTTDIVIDITRSKPWRVSLSLDDSGSKSTGKLQAGVNLGVDNPLGLNDLLNIGLSTDAQRDGQQRGTTGNNASYSIPFGYWTFGLAVSGYQYHQLIAGRFQTFTSSGDSKNLEFKIQNVFQRNQTQTNTVQFKTGKRWSHAYIESIELDNQRRNSSYAELAWVHKHYIGRARLDLSIANRWGVNWFNGDADLPTRQPDDPTFRYTLQTIDATLVVPFKIASQPITYIGTFRGQTTQSVLYATEQFSVGNRYTVRGFDGELTLAAERGFFLRNELELPIKNSGQAAYVGLDAGKVYGPSTQYLLGTTLAGAVVGLRGNVKGVSYDVFVGTPLVKPENFVTAAVTAGFSVSTTF